MRDVAIAETLIDVYRQTFEINGMQLTGTFGVGGQNRLQCRRMFFIALTRNEDRNPHANDKERKDDQEYEKVDYRRNHHPPALCRPAYEVRLRIVHAQAGSSLLHVRLDYLCHLADLLEAGEDQHGEEVRLGKAHTDINQLLRACHYVLPPALVWIIGSLHSRVDRPCCFHSACDRCVRSP